MQVGSVVKITNSNHSFWGECGTIVKEYGLGSFWVYEIEINQSPKDQPYRIEVTENDIEEYTPKKPKR